MADKKIYWHLPGFCYFRLLNQVLMNLMKDYPDCFEEKYCIGSVYGTFPGAVWNGGRAVFGITGIKDIRAILKLYNDRGVPVRFTWTNSLLEEKHIYDTYCNLIMKEADNGMNQVLVNRPVLEELNKDYFLVVLDYDLNHNEEVLSAIGKQADKVEILVNEICYPGCPKRSEHYRQQSQMQLEYDIDAAFPCPNKTRERKFEECKERPSFISREQIREYADRGFVNFKIVGRGMPMDFVKESYLYYLVKDDSRAFIRNKMESTLNQFAQAMRKRKA